MAHTAALLLIGHNLLVAIRFCVGVGETIQGVSLWTQVVEGLTCPAELGDDNDNPSASVDRGGGHLLAMPAVNRLTQTEIDTLAKLKRLAVSDVGVAKLMAQQWIEASSDKTRLKRKEALRRAQLDG